MLNLIVQLTNAESGAHEYVAIHAIARMTEEEIAAPTKGKTDAGKVTMDVTTIYMKGIPTPIKVIEKVAFIIQLCSGYSNALAVVKR